jgi:hypothetical protein
VNSSRLAQGIRKIRDAEYRDEIVTATRRAHRRAARADFVTLVVADTKRTAVRRVILGQPEPG